MGKTRRVKTIPIQNLPNCKDFYLFSLCRQRLGFKSSF